MAASNWLFYNEGKKYFLNSTTNLKAAGLRMKLAKGTAASAISRFSTSTFASCSGAATNMRTSGKKTPTFTVTQLPSAKAIRWDSDDPVFTCSGSNATSILYAVIGVSGGKAICWCKLTSSGTITVTPGNTLTVTINANGITQLTGGVS